jgi:acyl-CoA thioester hydrolase
MIAPPMPERFSIGLRVRYVECDMQGHVFNGHYLTWVDMAHTELLRAATGISYTALIARHGIDFVVAEANVRYLSPAHLDDELTIAAAPDPPGTTSLTTRFAIARDDEPIADAWLRHVCVDAGSYGKAPWPDAVRDALAPYVVADSTGTPSRPT